MLGIDTLRELLAGNITVRDLIEDKQGLWEMANISTRASGQKFDMWLDPAGKDRNVPHNVPRLKVEFEKGNRVPVSISRNPHVYAKNVNVAGMSGIITFISDHYVALQLHYNRKWDDAQILRYITLVGRKKMSISDALHLMLEDGDIDFIPEEFGID